MPVLVLIVFGLIDFGGVFAQQLALNNGVRQGARAAVVAGSPSSQTCAQIVAGVQRASGPAIALDTTKIAVQTNLTSSTTGTTIGVACAGGFRTTSTDAQKPCTGSYDLATSTSNSIKVESQYQSSFLVPLPIPVSAPMLRATAVYKCEFT